MQAQERMPIQLIWLLPPPVSPADSRPTPLTSPTLGSSRRLSSRREEAASLLVSELSAEDAPELVSPSEETEAALEAAALCVWDARLETAGAALLGAGAVLLGAGGWLLGAGGSLLGAGGSLLGAGGSLLTMGASLETTGGTMGSSGSDEASGKAVPHRSPAIRTAQTIPIKERKRFLLLFFIMSKHSPAARSRRPVCAG